MKVGLSKHSTGKRSTVIVKGKGSEYFEIGRAHV